MSEHLLEPLSPTSLDLAQQIRAHLGAAEEVGRSPSLELLEAPALGGVSRVIDQIKRNRELERQRQETINQYKKRLARAVFLFTDFLEAASETTCSEIKPKPNTEENVESTLRALLANRVTVGDIDSRSKQGWYVTGSVIGQKSSEHNDKESEIIVASGVAYALATVPTRQFEKLMAQKREVLTRETTEAEAQRYVRQGEKGVIYLDMKWNAPGVPLIGRDRSPLFKREIKPAIKVNAKQLSCGIFFPAGEAGNSNAHFLFDPAYQTASFLARLAQDFGREGKLKAALIKEQSSRK